MLWLNLKMIKSSHIASNGHSTRGIIWGTRCDHELMPDWPSNRIGKARTGPKSRHGLPDELVHDGQSIWNSCGQAPVAATVPIWTGLTSPDTQMAGAHTRIFRFVFLLPCDNVCKKKICAAETCWSSRGSDETSNFFSQWFCRTSITQSKNCILSATVLPPFGERMHS